MKHTLFKNLFFATFLLAFVVGCGKDGGGGGSTGTTLSGGNNLTGSSSAYYQNIANWYGAAEPQRLQAYRKISRTINVSNNTNTSSCPGEIKEIFGFIKICVYSNSGSSGGSSGITSNILYNVGLLPNTTNYDAPIFCDVANCVQQQYPGKGGNTKLQAALNGNGLYLQAVSQLSSTVYQLSYSTSTLDTTPRMIYKIDTNLHSLYNPVEIIDLTGGTQEYISF